MRDEIGYNAMTTNNSVSKILRELNSKLNTEEAENYKLLLCMAAGGLAPRGLMPIEKSRIDAFRVVLQCLRDYQSQGVMWRGRPPLMTNDLLTSLQAESRRTRSIAKETDRYLLGCGGQIADHFARDAELSNLVTENFPGVTATGIASYIYYEGEGHGLDPHVDTEVYTINVVLMLEHFYVEHPSHLLVYDKDIEPTRVLLAPGEMIILNAGSVVHAREDMGQDERVSILTVGFQELECVKNEQ